MTKARVAPYAISLCVATVIPSTRASAETAHAAPTASEGEGGEGSPTVAAAEGSPEPEAAGASARTDADALTVEQLRGELGHPDLVWRVAVVRELGERRAVEALPDLLALLRTEPSAEARGWIARALGEIGTPAARDALADAARRDPDTRLRRLAATLSGTSAEALPWEPGQGEPIVERSAPPSSSTLGISPTLERELRLRQIEEISRPPAATSSTALIGLTAAADLIGIPLMITGTFIPPFSAAGLFTMPFALADSIFLSMQQRAVERRGIEVNGAPEGVCWTLTAVSFAGVWIGSHMAFLLEWEGGPAARTGIALVALSLVSEAVNFFLRTLWWRPAITGPYRDYVRHGPAVDPDEL